MKLYNSLKRWCVIRNFFIMLIAVCLLPAAAFAQKAPAILTREIIVTRKDSVVRANILVNNTEIKINEALTYYWYFDDNINCNQGGYTGDLLHGSFTVLDMNSKLITKGNFLNGLKHGIWKYWYPNGNLKTTVTWEKGLIDGESQYFSKNGALIKIENYRNNQLHGEVISYKNGEVAEKRLFRNGEEKQIKEPGKKAEKKKKIKLDKPLKQKITNKEDHPDRKPIIPKRERKLKEDDQ